MNPSRKPPARFGAGLWRLADPKISLASMASIFLGACAAAAAGRIDVPWLLVTIAGIFAIEVAKNASGEIFDFDSGADLGVRPVDRSPFSGGKRVLVDGLLTRTQTWLIAAAGYVLGSVAGFAIVIWREPSIVWLGALGIFCAFFYQAPPLKLSYRGFGELAVAICYGPLISLGTYVVQRGRFAATPWLISIPLGLLIANFLLLNEFPDHNADTNASKRTLVVRLGRRRASRLFLAIFAAAFGILFLLPILGLPGPTLLGAIAMIPALAAGRRVASMPENTAMIIPAQANTLFTFLLYAIGTGIGLLIGQ